MKKIFYIFVLFLCFLNISSNAYSQIAASDPEQFVNAVINEQISDEFAAFALQNMQNIPLSQAQGIVDNIQNSYSDLQGTGAELLDLQNDLKGSFTQAIDSFKDGVFSPDLVDFITSPNIPGLTNITGLDDLDDIANVFDQAIIQNEIENMIDTLDLGQFDKAFQDLMGVITDIENLPQTIQDEIENAILGALPPALAQKVADLLAELNSTGGSSCGFPCSSNDICKKQCEPIITENHGEIRDHVTTEFGKHQGWMLDELLQKQILPAMGMMASQLGTVAMQQVNMIGGFFDAKHQMETQRLLQQLTTQAHNDYQPSEGLCVIGTNMRSLSGSQQKSNLVKNVLSKRIMDRQLRSGATVAGAGAESDIFNRLRQFKTVYCNKADNTNGLTFLCADGGNNPARMNNDINFTRTIETKLTLDIDFVDPEEPLTEEEEEAREDDPMIAINEKANQEDVMALMANLFAHDLTAAFSPLELATAQGKPRTMAYRYMDLRSVMAKRSVAQNAFVALLAQRSSGDKEVAPYLKKIVTELGLSPEETEEILGEKPSYFAQMEVLSKKLYQNPKFYTELYDKPANVLRKGAALQAISLMQQRDVFESQIRSEAIVAVMLEAALQDEKERLDGKLNILQDGGR